MKSSIEQFAVALYDNGLLQGNGNHIDDLLLHFKAMQQEQAQQYAEFCVQCDRQGLRLLEFNSWIAHNETYGGNK